MGRIKSKQSPSKEEKKNPYSQIIDLWKNEVNWHKYSKKDKIICICFGVSLTSLIAFCNSWLAFPALIGVIVTKKHIDNLDVEE